jgi:hypothetical protein
MQIDRGARCHLVLPLWGRAIFIEEASIDKVVGNGGNMTQKFGTAKIDSNHEETKNTKDSFEPISSVLLRALRFFVV